MTCLKKVLAMRTFYYTTPLGQIFETSFNKLRRQSPRRQLIMMIIMKTLLIMMMIMKTPSLSSLYPSLSHSSRRLSVHSFALLFEDFNALVVGLVWSLFLLKQITHTHTAHTQNIHTHRIYTHTQHTLIHINITLI